MADMGGIGATLEEIVDKTTGETMVAIRSLADKGTARTSGMLKVGDIITRVDKQHCSKMPPEKVQALLYGEAGTLVKIKYIRPPGEFEMTCTLTRERGNEHQLQEKHSGWKKQDLANNEAKEAEARRRANNVNHGYIKINEHAVRHKEDKMTKDELAEYFARQRAEHEANIRAADKYVAGLEALDERERKAKAERWAKENPGARSNPFAKKEHRAVEEARWQYEHVLGWKTRTQDEIAADQAEKERLWREKKARDESTFWNPFARMSSPEREGGSHLFGANEHHKKQWWDFFPEHKNRVGETRRQLIKATASRDETAIAKAAIDYKAAKIDKNMHDLLHGKQHNNHNWWDFGSHATSDKTRKKAGEHHWPWEMRKTHDEKYLDREVPMPWDGCVRHRKEAK